MARLRQSIGLDSGLWEKNALKALWGERREETGIVILLEQKKGEKQCMVARTREETVLPR